MLLTVDLTSDVPIYQQIRDRIVEAVAAGRIVAGSPLPATRQLAVDLGVNFHTVNRAYDLLRREGLLRLNRKTGAVIRRDARSGPPENGYPGDWQARLHTLLAEAVAHGIPDTDVVDACRSVLATFATQQGESA